MELSDLRQRVEEASGYLRISDLRTRRAELEEQAGKPDLWDDINTARALTKELADITDDINTYDSLTAALEEAETLNELAEDEEDETSRRELEQELETAAASLTAELDHLELRSLLSGEYDERDAVCQIQSGEGGTDAQDWAEMLLRMYIRWAERQGFETEIVSVREGQEAGITSAEFLVRGRYAYGHLQSEHGIHRLVRISPFNKEGKRHTAFSGMNVVPFFEDIQDEVEIDEADLRIDTYRSSGAGGQHVNVTDSAVRITHLPTGIVTSCQNERSQHQNKEQAMDMLAARLLDLERRRQREEIAEIAGEAKKVGFGSQIRSYVMHPFQLVKDLRSAEETSNFDYVLDGGIDNFVEAYLRWQRATKAAPQTGGAASGAASKTASKAASKTMSEAAR